jgi:hypothetical protein
MPYLSVYLNVVIDAFVTKTGREYLDDETLTLLAMFVVEKISQLKLCLAVDLMFELLKSLGNKQH